MAIFDIFKKKKGRALSFNAVVISDRGITRSNNEDNYVLGHNMNEDSRSHSEASAKAPSGEYIAAVFDGMGGIDRGELASAEAAKTLLQSLKNTKSCRSPAQLDEAIRFYFCEANKNVLALQEIGGMCGTTATLMCVTDGRFKVYHLGDSRAYLFRSNELFRLTDDHTLARMKLEMGIYDENDPMAELEKHKLTEFIGRYSGGAVRPGEGDWIELQTDDILLLCSDGLYDMCSDEHIKKILSSASSPKDAAEKLVAAALEGGGEDNVTCLVAQFT